MGHNSAGIDALINEFSPVLGTFGKACGTAQIGSLVLANIILGCLEGDVASGQFGCIFFLVLGNVAGSLSAKETTRFGKLSVHRAPLMWVIVAIASTSASVVASGTVSLTITSDFARASAVAVASFWLAGIFLFLAIWFFGFVWISPLAAISALAPAFTTLGLFEIFSLALVAEFVLGFAQVIAGSRILVIIVQNHPLAENFPIQSSLHLRNGRPGLTVDSSHRVVAVGNVSGFGCLLVARCIADFRRCRAQFCLLLADLWCHSGTTLEFRFVADYRRIVGTSIGCGRRRCPVSITLHKNSLASHGRRRSSLASFVL